MPSEEDKELIVELIRAHYAIKLQIEEVKAEAKTMKIEAHQLRDNHGGWTLAPLLVAKAQTLHAMVLLGAHS